MSGRPFDGGGETLAAQRAFRLAFSRDSVRCQTSPGVQFENADIIGVTVGSGAHFVALNASLAEHRIKPVIDGNYEFESAPSVVERLKSARHFGRIVIRV